jgi:riboflavin kinase/FMN adenylyltransferase
MQLYHDYKNLPSAARGGVLAIGNFDGVHRGHQALLAAARVSADKNGTPMGVMTFEPHPRRLFRPDDPPFRITPPAVKHRRLAESGVDFILSLPFDWNFASQSAQDFIDRVLKAGPDPAHIVVGSDFAFGQLRKGTPQTLRDAGFAVTVLDKVADEGEDPLSSSRIREALCRGEIATANDMLGWAWEIEGIVVKGDQRGRTIGFPTANVMLGDTLHPAYGIYATWVQIEGEAQWRPAATNIGIRPMFELKVGQVEAYIMDYSGDLYGTALRIRPVARLRGEAKFDSLDALVAQIEKDCADARDILSG